ncbi:cholecystokinin receptor-like [Tachypleus tridentatus]|uniref:cholecystokinin receptor-like n=1 Tax=Tachypleus tridentatus TaxID=6853 RepID=UPI003FD604A4
MLPLAVLSRLLPTNISGRYKCRDVWPNITSERVFNIYLDAALLIVPLVIMAFMYFLIVHTLYVDLENENEDLPLRFLTSRSRKPPQNLQGRAKPVIVETGGNKAYNTFTITSRSRISVHRHLVVRGNYTKGRVAKKQIIRMLFVIVLIFFICWTPLFVINTWILFNPITVYQKLSPSVISIIHLLAYFSSCCNPITYCFMHIKYREAFLAIFSCRYHRRRRSYRWSNKSATFNSMYSPRAISIQTSK